MPDRHEVREMLRRRILGKLHVGSLRAGDRLASIRQVTAETGADHRAVAAAYRALEEEGLVEVRAGSGVYVASAGPVADVLPETAHWLAGVLTEAWERRIPRAELGRLAARCTGAGLRCACIESNEDHLVALTAALAEEFSVDAHPVRVAVDAAPGGTPPDAVAEADLVVTTAFHAEYGRWAAEAAGRPLVVAALDRDFVRALDRQLAAGGMTAVFVDRGFQARGEAFMPWHTPRTRYVPLDQMANAIPPVDPRGDAVLLTRAARRALGMDDFHLLPPPARFIGPETARELQEVIVRIALERTA